MLAETDWTGLATFIAAIASSVSLVIGSVAAVMQKRNCRLTKETHDMAVAAEDHHRDVGRAGK